MVKEPVQERDSAIKKRRKGGSSSSSAPPAKVPEGDIYKVCILVITIKHLYCYLIPEPPYKDSLLSRWYTTTLTYL
jgi:hypothetical protein